MYKNLQNSTTLSFILAACLFFASGWVSAAESLDKVVAVVNGSAISQNELDDYLKFVKAEMQEAKAEIPQAAVLREQVLNRMIIDRIQEQRAVAQGLEVDSLTVSKTLQEVADHNGQTLAEYRQSLESRGLNFDLYRSFIKRDLLLQRLQGREVLQNVSVAKHEVESFLRSPAGQDGNQTQYRLSHILINSSNTPDEQQLKQLQAQAEDVARQLRQGQDFAKLAAKHSAGRQALNGGDLGWRAGGELPSLFVNVAPALKKGEIAGPIRNANGFHIIKLTDKKTNTRDKQEVYLEQIVSNNAAEANKLHERLRKGEDFHKVAGSKLQDRGWVSDSKILSKLKANQSSEPYADANQWVISRVRERRTKIESSEAAWQKAMQTLSIRKTNEAMDSWLKRLRDEANVEIMPS